MIYRKAGTNKVDCIEIRVMPGNPTSPVTSQHKPYVVQRKGNHAISLEGKEVLYRSDEAHIPLDKFKMNMEYWQ